MGAETASRSLGLRRLSDAIGPGWPSVIAGAAAIALLAGMAWDSGGYFPPAYLVAGAGAYAVAGLLLLFAPPTYVLSTQALVAIGALAALAVWTGISANWSTAADTALDDMQRDLAYVGIFGLGLLAAGSGRLTRYLVWCMLGLVLAIVGASLVSRLYPDLIPSPLYDLAGYRLAYPLGYWNALGALASLGAVLALGLASDPRARVPLRAVAAGASVVMATAMYLSFSRGAWLAMGVGLVVLVALGAHRGSLLLTSVVVGLAFTLAITRLQAYPALTDDPAANAGQLSAGHEFGPQLALIVAGTVGAQAMIAAGRASTEVMYAARRLLLPLLLGAAIVAAIGAAGVYAVKQSAIEGRVTDGLHSADRFVSRQWADFLRPTAAVSLHGTERLRTSKGSRSDLYRVAIDSFEAHPLRGEGAGSFEYRYIRTRGVSDKARNAHSLYLETLGELGVVGALLLLMFIGSLVAAAIRSRARPGALGRAQSAAVGAACAVWVAHSAVDWDWQISAFTGIVLVLGATLYPLGRVRRAPREPAAASRAP